MAQRTINNRYELLLIGGSAGSLDVLINLLPSLDQKLEFAIVIVLHRKAGESLLVDLLSDKTKWLVKEAEDKESIERRTIYVAPPDYHLLIEKDKTFSLDFSEKVHFSRPAIDVSFETAAEAYGPALMALLLSGANADGAEGLRHIKQNGGMTIVQDPKEASVSYMPQQAIELTKVDYIAPTPKIINIINRSGQ
jgi:two-component system, chemotaxis family, protein-glutamate methylesterase/glutaminase